MHFTSMTWFDSCIRTAIVGLPCFVHTSKQIRVFGGGAMINAKVSKIHTMRTEHWKQQQQITHKLNDGGAPSERIFYRIYHNASHHQKHPLCICILMLADCLFVCLLANAFCLWCKFM